MKHTILFATVLSTFIFTSASSTVSAIDVNLDTQTTVAVQASSSPRPSSTPGLLRKEVQDLRKDLKQDVRELRGDTKQKIQEERTENKEKRQEARDAIAGRHAVRLENRFSVYAKQLTDISVRIQTRIDKEKSDGKDVIKAQELLNTAKTTLAKAIEDGKKAVDAFKNIQTEEWLLQKTAAKAAIDLAQTARTEFVQSRKLMVEAVVALKTN